MDKVDVLVVGAGVIGLAIAREFAIAKKEVVILESQPAYGSGTSARNSGVIHAGIYYPTGSKKAQWCVRGRHLLYEYAKSHHIGHQRLGKLIVARREEAEKLEVLYRTGLANGVEDLVMISGDEARRMEPALECDLAIHSPSTGIIDAHELMHALLGDAQAHGAMLAVGSRFQRAEPVQGAGGGWRVTVSTNYLGEDLQPQSRQTGGPSVTRGAVDDTEIACGVLINAAGLDAIPLAHRILGLDRQQIPEMFFAKGNYARLKGKSPFGRLIYPVPVPGGLGTHLTIDLGGQAQFGPDVEWLSAPSHEEMEGGLINAFDYAVNETRLENFERDIRTWWPGLPDHALMVGYAGVRPKLVGPGAPAADFMVQGPKDHGLAGLVNLFGMESPGLTSCLAIGQAVRGLVE